MKHNKLLKWGLVALAVLTLLCSITIIGFAQESEPNAPTLSIKTFNLSLENAVFMNFKVGSENVSNPANIKLLAWNQVPAEYKKGTEDACLSSRGTEAGTGYEIFQYNDLAAKDMTKMVYVCAYVNEDGVEAYSAPAKFSIAMYAYLKKNATNPDTDLCKLLDAMLSYGAASQIYFNHNTNLLATDTLHQITVQNGTLPDGFAKGWYKENTTVTLTANAAENGFTFSHWTNSAGEEVSTEATITVDVTKAETYTANYKKAGVYSQGLEFTSNGDGTCYVSGIGTCTDTDINIPPLSPEGWTVTSIGSDAFYKCSSLISITIPEGVTSIGSYAFNGCSSLTSITTPDSVTSIGTSAFNGCTSLTSITIPDSVTSIGTAAFASCSSLASIMIPEGVTSIGTSAFNGCTSLTSITIPDSVTSIGLRAFYDCGRLTSITFAENSKLTSIGNGAFEYCRNLSSITIPDSVTSIGSDAFRNCSSLTSITIPSSVINIDQNAFSNCSNLESVIFTENSKLTSIGNYAFYLCSSLTSISIPAGVTSIGSSAFSYCSSLTSITIPDSVTSIGSSAFYYCNSLASITIPANVTSIDSYAFAGCASLARITFAKGSKLTSIGNCAFLDCFSLRDVYVADLNTWLKISFGDDFAHPNTYGALHILDDNGNEITNLVIPDTTTEINDFTFLQCINITSVTIPNSVTRIGNLAFTDCMSLTSVTFAKNSELTVIDAGAFFGCISLAQISIPENVTTIGDQAFMFCSSLTNITIPNSVISIGCETFSNCSSLGWIIIGNSVTTIGDYAFYECNNLFAIFYFGTPSNWMDISIGDGQIRALRYYYSEFMPHYDPNSNYVYWHYVDGVPTNWSESYN